MLETKIADSLNGRLDDTAYEYTLGRTIKNGKDGPIILANFQAIITDEITYIDGKQKDRILVVIAEKGNDKLEPVQIPADKFASMSWVTPAWGTNAVISPVANAERELRAAISYASNPTKQTVYTHTGWTRDGKNDLYLTANGGISKKGYLPNIKVLLPAELKNFKITPDAKKRKQAIKATLSLVAMGPPQITWPLVIAAIRAPLSETDYALHISGRTGTFKSELASIVQSHFGPEMDARHLPGSWSSTANALEAQCYKAKDAPFVVDDFVPFGTAWQVRAYQKTADQLIRGAGNQAGRARLTDISSLQTTMYPRCQIFSTGEDVPQGHSIRARMLIVDIAPSDIDTKRLTIAQENREIFQHGTAAWIQWIATNGLQEIRQKHIKRRTELRDAHQDVGHSRTPAMLGDMIATVEIYTQFAKDSRVLTATAAEKVIKHATEALIIAANDQQRHLTATDPTDAFTTSLRLALQSNLCHLRTLDGGIPSTPTIWGWTEKDTQGEIKQYTAHGPKIGWLDRPNSVVNLDPDVAFPIVQRASRGTIAITKQTMWKRLKDVGKLARTEASRGRNTVRVTCEGHSRSVISIPISAVTENEEEQ